MILTQIPYTFLTTILYVFITMIVTTLSSIIAVKMHRIVTFQHVKENNWMAIFSRVKDYVPNYYLLTIYLLLIFILISHIPPLLIAKYIPLSENIIFSI